jgi:glutamine amidotransferase
MDFIDKDDPCIIGNIELKEKIPVIIKNKNIVGVQFHPEKSQTNGINFLKDFIDKKLYEF